MAWQVVKDPSQEVVHVIPLNDLEPHYETVECRCEPEHEVVDFGACDLLIHNAWDGRIS